jgi:hypothetical protein
MRDVFTGLPKELYIPKNAEVVFVADFFVSDLVGGAELTSEALIKASPRKVCKIHSSSLTEEMLKQNRDKVWIFGNQTLVQPNVLVELIRSNIGYYFFEYDFKPCILRSTKKHELQSGKECDCHLNFHGKLQSKFMTSAKKLFWCSDGQKDKFYGIYPNLKENPNETIHRHSHCAIQKICA